MYETRGETGEVPHSFVCCKGKLRNAHTADNCTMQKELYVDYITLQLCSMGLIERLYSVETALKIKLKDMINLLHLKTNE